MKVKFILWRTPYEIDKLVVYNVGLPLLIRNRYSIFMKPRIRKNKPITVCEILDIISDPAYVKKTHLTRRDSEREIREMSSPSLPSVAVIIGSFQLPIEYEERVDNIKDAIYRLADKIKKLRR